MAGLRADFGLRRRLVVDVQRGGAPEFAVIAGAFLPEVDPDDVPARRGCVGPHLLLRRDAQEVVGVGDLAVLEIQGVTTES